MAAPIKRDASSLSSTGRVQKKNLLKFKLKVSDFSEGRGSYSYRTKLANLGVKKKREELIEEEIGRGNR